MAAALIAAKWKEVEDILQWHGVLFGSSIFSCVGKLKKQRIFFRG